MTRDIVARQQSSRSIPLQTMKMNLAQEPDFALGGVCVRPSRGIVTDGVVARRVAPLVMQALLVLLRADGRTVSRDELVEACWAGRVVSEDAISRVIAALRSLARQFDPPPFTLETIPKVGFQLDAADRRNGQSAAAPPELDEPPPAASPLQRQSKGRRVLVAVVGLLLLVMAAGAWWLFRTPPAAAHGMTVRLSGFRILSGDLPTTMRDSINAEITAALKVDGAISVSTAPAPSVGSAYALDGTIYRVGDAIRVITRFTNQRSGVVLWSESADYAADQVSKVPHKTAVEAGIVVRCGLSGASTYKKSLPDPVLSNYLQYCQQYWAYGGSKTLLFAQRVVAARPDFSWGWSAVGNGYMQSVLVEPDRQRAEALRAAGSQAEDRALALDRNNSEALSHKAYLIDPHDWFGQEALFKRAIAAQPLDCGCEHFGYGVKLRSVGRLRAAVDQFSAATDMLALWHASQLALGWTLVATDRLEQARPHLDAAIDLSKDPNFDKEVAVTLGAETGDYAAAIAALRSPQFQSPEDRRAALLLGYEALASASPPAKTRAVQALLALPKDRQDDTVATLLGALGANREALQFAAHSPSVLWLRSLRGALDEPTFPAIANQLGLMTYWRKSGTKPDVCLSKTKPAFCQMI